MSQFTALLIAGIAAGGVYALLATGLVVTYRSSGVFNFAHGAVAYVTAVLFFQLRDPSGLSWPPALAAAVSVLLFAPLFGFVLDRVMMRALAVAPESARIIGTIGLLIAIPALARWVVDTANRVGGADLAPLGTVFATPGLGPSPVVVWTPWTGVAVDSDQVVVFVSAAFAAFGLWLLLAHTRFGLLTRATVDRRWLARLRGVDVDRVSTVWWMIGFGLAGLAGVVMIPLFQLDESVFTLLVFGSFSAVVLARFASLPVAFAGGMAIGVVQNLAYGYAPDAVADVVGFRSAIPFLLLFALVVWRGRSHTRVASVPTDDAYVAPASFTRPWVTPAAWTAAAAVVAFALAFVVDDFWAQIVARGLAFGFIFLSFTIVTGIGGMVSLAQAALVSTGGLVVGALTTRQLDRTIPVLMDNGRFTFFAATVIAGIVAAALGVVIALPTLRVSGLAFAIASLALAFICDQLVFPIQAVGNGSLGWSVRAPSIGPWDLATPRAMGGFLLVVALAGVAFVTWLPRTRVGRAAIAVRSSPAAAAVAGISPLRSRTTLFALAAAFAGVGGALLAPLTTPFTSETTPAAIGIVWLAVVASVGIRRPAGALLAGLLFAALPELLAGVASWSVPPFAWLPSDVRLALDSPEVAAILFGFGAIGYARRPEGVLGAFGRRARRATRAVPVRDARTADGARTAPIPRDAALQVHDIRVVRDGVAVIAHVTFAVGVGELAVVVGDNGAGKSTLCGALSGLVRTDAGSITVAGTLIVEPELRGVFPGLDVDDNLAVTLVDPSTRDDVYTRFPALAARRHVDAQALSGGEQQMLALAPPLVRPPQVLVVDEPFLGLAPQAASDVARRLDEIRATGTAVLVTGEVVPAVLRPDRVYRMTRGRLEECVAPV